MKKHVFDEFAMFFETAGEFDASAVRSPRGGPRHVQAVAVVDVGDGEDDGEVRDEPERVAQERRQGPHSEEAVPRSIPDITGSSKAPGHAGTFC